LEKIKSIVLSIDFSKKFFGFSVFFACSIFI